MCLTALFSEGKTRILRTRDGRRIPGSPKFPLAELAAHSDAFQAKKSATTLSPSDFAEAIFSLEGDGAPDIKWDSIAPTIFTGQATEAMGGAESSDSLLATETYHALDADAGDFAAPEAPYDSISTPAPNVDSVQPPTHSSPSSNALDSNAPAVASTEMPSSKNMVETHNRMHPMAFIPSKLKAAKLDSMQK